MHVEHEWNSWEHEQVNVEFVSTSLVRHDKSLFKAHSPASKSGSKRLNRIFSASTRINGLANAFGKCLESGAHFFSLRLAHTNTYLSCQTCRHQKSLQTYGCSNRTQIARYICSHSRCSIAKCRNDDDTAIEPNFEHVEWHRSVVGGSDGGVGSAACHRLIADTQDA